MAGRPEPYRRRTRRAHAAGGDRRRARPGAAQPRHAGAAAGGAAPVRQPHAAGRAARRPALPPSPPNQVLFGAHGAAEQDMERTWHDTAATLQALAQRLPNLAARTVALAAT